MDDVFYIPEDNLPGLTAEEVLKQAFEIIIRGFEPVRIPTEQPLAERCVSVKDWAEDGPGEDKGYMYYPNLYGFPNDWVFGVGEHWGHIGRWMRTDIYGFQFPWRGPTDDLIGQLRTKVGAFNDFSRVRAPLVALFTGQFAVGEIHKALIPRYRNALEDCIAYPDGISIQEVVLPEVKHTTSPYVRYTAKAPERVAGVLAYLMGSGK